MSDRPAAGPGKMRLMLRKMNQLIFYLEYYNLPGPFGQRNAPVQVRFGSFWLEFRILHGKSTSLPWAQKKNLKKIGIFLRLFLLSCCQNRKYLLWKCLSVEYIAAYDSYICLQFTVISNAVRPETLPEAGVPQARSGESVSGLQCRRFIKLLCRWLLHRHL